MASSSYYYSLMMQYAQEKRLVQEKKEKWEIYLGKLNSFNGVLPNILSSVSACNSSLLGGGYLVGDGVSLDNGKLQTVISKLESDCDLLSGVITHTQNKIEEFANKITELTNQYNDAKANYERALAAEREAAADAAWSSSIKRKW